MTLKRKVLSAMAALAAIVAVAAVTTSASAGTTASGKDVSADFTTQGGVAPAFLSNARTIPHWSSTPTRRTYPTTMTGSDPRTGGSITIHTVIVPLKMHFVAGNQPAATTTAASTTPSTRSSRSGSRRRHRPGPARLARPALVYRRLTYMGTRTTSLGGPYAGFGTYAQGC